MHPLCLLLTAVAATGNSGPLRPSWEKLYDAGDGATVGPVHAMARDDWSLARGRAGLVTSRAGALHVEDTHDHGVLGFFADAPGSLYALGEGELIWHFDGTVWTEQHIAPRPPPGRHPFAAHMLYVGFVAPTQVAAGPVAVGLELALVRQADGGWVAPAPDERARLGRLGLLGPDFAPPAGCARAGWRWLGPDRGAFTCHDGRVFTWDVGGVVAKGKLPGPCAEVLDTLVQAPDGLIASCRFSTLWKEEARQWRRIVAPREKGLSEFVSLSVAQGCLFVASKRAVWRSCEP